MKDILLLAQSRRERELICFTAHISGNLTQTSAKKHLGLHNMNQRILDVERCISEAKLVHETIEEMVKGEIDSLTFQDSYSDSSYSEDEDCVDHYQQSEVVLTPDAERTMINLLQECHFNWFELVNQLEEREEHLDCLPAFYDSISNDNFTEKELELIQQPYLAFKADKVQYFYIREQAERMLDGEVVTESESDNPELVTKKKVLLLEKG